MLTIEHLRGSGMPRVQRIPLKGPQSQSLCCPISAQSRAQHRALLPPQLAWLLLCVFFSNSPELLFCCQLLLCPEATL